jgi:hypothetical protein
VAPNVWVQKWALVNSGRQKWVPEPTLHFLSERRTAPHIKAINIVHRNPFVAITPSNTRLCNTSGYYDFFANNNLPSLDDHEQ